MAAREETSQMALALCPFSLPGAKEQRSRCSSERMRCLSLEQDSEAGRWKCRGDGV